MIQYFLKLSAFLFTAILISFAAIAQDFDYAVEAYQADDYVEALPIFQDLADTGNDDAMWYLGKLYDNGWGVGQSDTLSLEWFTKSAELGDADSMWEVGIFYETGQGIDVDQKTAFSWYLQSAEGGRAEAMTEVGQRYENGNGVRKSNRNAFKWYLRGAEAGDAAGQAFTGYGYEFGQGVRASEEDAVYWYLQAAAQDHPDGLAWLGEMYESGTGVDQDIEFARELYSKAEALGNDYAAGRLEALGGGAQISVQTAGYTPADTSDENCNNDLEIEDMQPDCQYGIALNMVQGLSAYDIARPILEKLSSEHQHADSEFLLGTVFTQADGWSGQSIAEGFEYFLKSADHGHPEALSMVGGAYLVGEMGQTKDEALGVDYLKKAARQGHERSQVFLESQDIAWKE